MRSSRLKAGIGFLFLTFVALPATAQGVCADFPGSPTHIGFTFGVNDPNPPGPNCLNFFWCYPPQLSFSRYEVIGSCDPNTGPCTIRAVVTARFPGNSENQIFGNSYINLEWRNSQSQTMGTCGVTGAAIDVDRGEPWIQISNFHCGATPPAGADTYTLITRVCPGATDCPRPVVNFPVPLDLPTLEEEFCDFPPPPPPFGCGDSPCSVCLGGGGGSGAGPGGGAGPSPPSKGGGCASGTSVGGGGATACPQGGGPGVTLRYLGGGAGHPGFPGSTAWNTALGRYWSHDAAERIVLDPDPAHVWLITRWATFREFTDANTDGLYESVAPSDEYRTLSKTVAGWELRDLDGTLQHFDNAGLWTHTVDRNGNASQAHYTGGVLTSITFPDERSESFTYHPGGKLATVSEVGVDGVTVRTWSYTWTGEDLTRIDRPDGTAWKLIYGDLTLPGYLTQMVLVGTDLSERVERAWEYDDEGNAVKMWRGATSFTDPGAVDKWSLAFDDPELPTETEVTDPLNNVMTYTVGRDAASIKPRVEQITGDCPTCGLGPNSQLFYEDPQNPLRQTREIDGRGTQTRFSWDGNGMMTSRIEAFGTALERESTWQYHPTWPALLTEMSQPSTTGNLFDERRTLIGYDAVGNATTRTIEGVEDASAFSYETVTTYTTEGQPEVVDPPGYGTDDQTSFTYDPARGELVMDSRTEPLIGTTSYAHDPFNRRTAMTDPNGVVSETVYDALDRVRFTIQRGATPAEDLITEHVYDIFGDLFQTILPEGNVIEYSYDAAGRLTSIERKPDASPSSHGERTVYELDGFGHRIHEEQQRWDGAAWVAEAATAYEYSTRCHLDKMIAGAGSPSESVTEYDYDCDGNLERIWDPNHPSAGQSAPATTVYSYDDLDRLATVTQPWGGAGGGSVVTSYGYDVQDHLTQVTDGEGNVTQYDYSDRDLMTEERSPVSGTGTYLYNEHGEMVHETDDREITVLRTLDALDRTTFVNFADDALDVTYTYDDPLVPFSLGRLTAIERDGASVEYRYDRFGRQLQDGELTYAYDENGNRVEIGYPEGVTAHYSHDFADRPATLAVVVDGGAPQPLVTAASYLPGGPLAELSLANGRTEVRTFDERYFPRRIEVPGLLDWSYVTDAVGNVTEIERLISGSPVPSTFGYQDAQYYLTEGEGPWGHRLWSYDKIGNRLTDTQGGSPPSPTNYTYTYAPNPLSGNNPKLELIEPALRGDGGGSTAYAYDAVGNQITVTTTDSEGLVEAGSLAYDEASRLAQLSSSEGTATTALSYDGRSFLRESRLSYSGLATVTFTEPVYSSEGLLHTRRFRKERSRGGDGDDDFPSLEVAHELTHLLYFAGRPVAQLRRPEGAADELRYLTADHLGSPVLVSDPAGALIWQGTFEPWGEPVTLGERPNDDGDALLHEPGKALGGLTTGGVFLRFPGQWDDETWSEPGLGVELYYNVHRWYQAGTGKYVRPDPAFFDQVLQKISLNESFPSGDPREAFAYVYAADNALVNTDESGLAHCVYRIRSRELKCRFKEGFVESVNPEGIFSGFGRCTNNPNCQNIPNIGPIKPGIYKMNFDERPGHETWWRLEPVPKVSGLLVTLKIARGGFALHTGTRSAGCITIDKNADDTVQDYMRLYNLLLGEWDSNVMQVLP